MRGLITEVEQAFTAKGAEYKKVTVLDDKGKTTTKNVFDNLSDKWPLLEENKYREFKMEKSGQFWNVIDILEVDIPGPQPSDRVLPQHQEVIDEAKKLGVRTPTTRESSIEQQVAIKEIGECWRVGKLGDKDPLVMGYLVWLIDRLNYQEAKSETIKDNKGDTETQTESSDRQDSREATGKEPKTVGEFLTWLQDHNIKAPRAWLEVEYKIGSKEVLTIRKCQALYATIKTDKEW